MTDVEIREGLVLGLLTTVNKEALEKLIAERNALRTSLEQSEAALGVMRTALEGITNLLAGWMEANNGSGWKRAIPWRVRSGVAALVRQLVWSRCTRCGAAFSLRELLARDGSLTHFMSGSICHRDCGPSEDFKRMVAEIKLRQAKVDSFLHPQPPAQGGAE